MGEMQQKMEEQNKQQDTRFNSAPKGNETKAGKHDYIEFEEIK